MSDANKAVVQRWVDAADGGEPEDADQPHGHANGHPQEDHCEEGGKACDGDEVGGHWVGPSARWGAG